MSLTKRVLELGVYAAVGVVIVTATLFYAEKSQPGTQFDARWLGLLFFTALTFGYPIRWYYRRRRRRTWRFWRTLATLFLAHVGCFVVILLLVESWPLILFVVIMPVEWHFILPILEKAGAPLSKAEPTLVRSRKLS